MSSIDVHMGTSTEVLMVCILTFMPSISWSWFSTLLWHDSQYAIYSSLPDLHRICTLYWCICTAWCTVTIVTMLPHPCWSWPTAACGQWWHVLPLQSTSSDWTFWAHAVYPVLPFQCCYPATLCWRDFYWQTQLGRGLHCPEPPHACSTCLPISATNWLQGLHQMHLSLRTRALKHHKISCKHPLQLTFWPCHICLGMSHSMTTQPLPT